MKTKRKRQKTYHHDAYRALRIVQKYAPHVEYVVDATQDLPIQVTPKDIASKGRKDHNGCVLAEACKRQEHATTAIIARSTAYIVKGNVATRYRVSPTVSREIVSFDRGASFEPGEYVLTVHSEQHQLGHHREHSPRGPGQKKRAKPHVTRNVRASLQTA